MTAATAASSWPRGLRRSRRRATSSRIRGGRPSAPAAARPSFQRGSCSSARIASTTTRGLPSLMDHIRSSTRATIGASLPTRASARTRRPVSSRDRGARATGSAWAARARSSSVRRAREAPASSSSRAVATSSARHPGARRPTKASRRRLISSAQCRSSRISTSGCRAASCSTSWATLSNRGRAPVLLRQASRGGPASGKRRASSALRAGWSAPEDLFLGAGQATVAGLDPGAERQDRVALVAATDEHPSSPAASGVGSQRADEPGLADAGFAEHRGDDASAAPMASSRSSPQPARARPVVRTAASPSRGDPGSGRSLARTRDRGSARASGAGFGAPTDGGADPGRASASPPPARSQLPRSALTQSWYCLSAAPRRPWRRRAA